MRFERRGPDDQFGDTGSNGSLIVSPALWRYVWVAGVAVGLIFLFVILSVARGVYTDWLWFDHLGFLDLFSRILITRIWLFLAGGLLMGLLVGVNLYLVYRFSAGPTNLPLPANALIWLRRVSIAGIVAMGAVIGVSFGAVASGRWETVILFMNSVPFGFNDPVYHTDVSFYVFKMPLFHLVQGWLFGAAVILLMGSLVVYVLRFNMRGINFVLTRPIRTHLAVLGGLVMFTIGLGHFLDTYEILLSPGGAVPGATYTDIVARRPALLMLTAIAGLAGILMFGSALLRDVRRGVRLAVAALGLWAILGVVVGILFPAFVQRFMVDPNELVQEEPYIERNILWTQLGFGLDRVVDKPYTIQEEIPKEVFQDNRETIENIRLWDPRPLEDVYNQKQHLRLYYDFLDVDVDRYVIDGQYRQVLLGARELSTDKLPAEAQRWSNQKLQYTHGYGVVMSPVTEHTSDGSPEFYIKDVPPQGRIPVERPQIYYGEGQQGFVIVGSKIEEFDHPSITEGGAPVYASQEGTGGVSIGTFLRRLAYAWEFADINVLISGQLTPESRIQYRRTVQERVQAVVPFLSLDRDPYLVVEGGKLYWIQDAYTVTNRFPYSTSMAGEVNYIRNSVKAVVDAFDGTVRLFVAEPDDPLLLAYANAFPGLFLSMETMPPGLRAHIRYPEDLFMWQAKTYLQYHMTDPRVFFNKEDQWSIPSEVFFGATQSVEPYHVMMRLPGEENEEFILLIPFTPAKKPNMVAWLAARNDGPHYGELVAFRFQADRQIDGPSQVEARIDNDDFISQQFTLWGQAGSTVVRGKLLVIPIGGTILYAEPIYLQASGLRLPQLKRVILATQDRVVMTPTLQDSLLALLEYSVPVLSPADQQAPMADGIQAERLHQVSEALEDAIQALQDNLTQLQEALEILMERSQQ